MKIPLPFLLAVSLSILLLSGCIFDGESGNGNKEPQKGPGPIEGFVSMVDARGFTEKEIILQSDILGRFWKKAAAKSSFYSSMMAFEAMASREMKCTFSTEKAGDVQRAATRQNLISVGDLSIGLTEEKPSQINQDVTTKDYYGILKKGTTWKSGEYRVKSAGSDLSLGFEGVLSMPAVLENPAVNGSLIENGPISIVAQSPIELTWTKQVKPGVMDYMLFQMFGEQDGSRLNLICGVKESEVLDKWTIPAEKLKDFTSAFTKGQVYLYRANLARAEDEKVGRLDTEGLRLALSTVAVTN